MPGPDLAAIERLLALLGEPPPPAPPDLAAALQGLPEPGALPSPWDTWTLLGLVRHRARQQWLLGVVRTRLRADPDALAHAGAFAHPAAIPDHGPVPDLPGWSYAFHGSGCCLTCEATGEALDVDFDDDTAEHFDTYFYIGYVASLRDPDVPEARLSALCPDRELIALAVEDLQAAGVLVRGSHRVYFRLSPRLLAVVDAVDRLADALRDPAVRLWHAARLGDWAWAHELADDPGLRALLAPRARRCRELRLARLEQARDSGDDREARLALAGFAALAVDDLDERLIAALDAPPSGLVSCALEHVEARWHERFAGPVLALLARLDPRGAVPQPHLFSTCARLLLLHDVGVADVQARIAAADAPVDARLLALDLHRRGAAALPLVRAGLRSRAPLERNETAALLALLDAPWSRRELLAALASDDLEATSECRAALRLSVDPHARAAVDAWDRLHPYPLRDAPPYTGLDVHLHNCEAWLAEACDDLGEFLGPYRARLLDLERRPD
ncbi:MAG: hypothetical protein JNL82_30700 [Myxococcales bacterium]|nr:hypothetical protein [Myxococcales bacterium]